MIPKVEEVIKLYKKVLIVVWKTFSFLYKIKRIYSKAILFFSRSPVYFAQTTEIWASDKIVF